MPCGLKLKISGSNTQDMTPLKLGETAEFKSPNFFSGDGGRGTEGMNNSNKVWGAYTTVLWSQDQNYSNPKP